MDYDRLKTFQENIAKVIIGKPEVIKLTLVTFLARGHLLIEDVPGVGKTTLAMAFARSLQCSFKRIQLTPDLLPSDIIGVSIYNQKSKEFEFMKGPIFANIVLADEINRATPRTQSALLEAMGEKQVSVDGVTHKLEDPFFVVATLNPVEYHGTFPLPEAQLDRFTMKIRIGYPDFAEEKTVLEHQQYTHPLDHVKSQFEIQEMFKIQEEIKSVKVSNPVYDYILKIVEKTRNSDKTILGASPRGSIALYRTCQALAFLSERDFCLPDDVKKLASQVLAHRLIIHPRFAHNGITNEMVMQEILEEIEVPI
ncbi:MAG: hypothetical protein A2161_19350 [Candidatus Schekmanbacteria bacterium RBG_13_48_7]|uniref:AAA+ ATPase domain-containing protein n=1 Tax=Candidatus Schekmanbacteria bacterium RBG_13_48_7 TaxID=1817878 RepID=A0A1F7RQ04_9BACT|nr:MAG: hypothetical protein A2161_19350 [Candidatus Schekmanbacteria bacterium RBG_13_48_7]